MNRIGSTKTAARITRRHLMGLAAAVFATANMFTGHRAEAEELDTAQPGVLEIGIYNGAMPYAGEKDGAPVGLEGELIAEAAKKLGLKTHISQGSFATMLAEVQAGRIDVLIGSIGWNASRAASGRFTEPVFYSPIAAAVANGVKVDTIEDLSGKQIAVSAGGYWSPGLKELKDANPRVYDNLAAMLADVAAGRVDVVLYDPLPLIDAKKKRPDMPFDVKYISGATNDDVKAHPGYSVFRPYMVSWYMPPKAEKLEQALNKEILAMYSDGFLAKTIQSWGGEPKSMLTPEPGFAKDRQGVDRPADWTPPTVK